MADRYQQFADSPPGRFMVRRLGLPRPAVLRRGPELVDDPVLLAGSLRLPAGLEVHDRGTEGVRYGALIYDASGVSRVAELRGLYDFFHDSIAQLAPCGRLVVVGMNEI